MKKLNIKKSTNKQLLFLQKLFNIKSISVYQLTLIVIVISSVLSIIITVAGWAISESNRFEKEINALEEVAIDKKKEKLHEEVFRLISYLEYLQQDSIPNSQEELKEKALNYFERIRFGNDGYVFVNTYNGDALIFNGEKLEEPKKMSQIKLLNDKNLFEVEMNLAKLPNGGSFQYEFLKINDSIPSPKMSYVMGFDKWGWIIGAGDYLDNLDSQIIALEKGLKNNLYNNILIIFIFFTPILILLLYLFSTFFAQFIQNQFNNFVQIIKNSTPEKENKHSLNHVFISDLKAIGMDILQADELVKQFGNIINHLNNQIYIIGKGNLKFVYANKGAVKKGGYSFNDLQKMTFLDILPDFNKNKFLTLVKPLIQKEKEKILFESYSRRKNDTEYEVEVQLTSSFFNKKEVIVAFLNDITERNKAKKELKSSEQRFVTFMNNTSALAWIKDENLNYIFLNKTYEKLFNISLKTIKGKDDFAIFDKETAMQLQKNDRFVLNNNKLLETEEIVSDNKGNLSHYLINKFTIKSELGITNVGGMAINITDRKKAEEELANYREHLEELVKERTLELEEKNKKLDKLNKVFVGRELRMAELKEENKLLQRKIIENNPNQ